MLVVYFWANWRELSPRKGCEVNSIFATTKVYEIPM